MSDIDATLTERGTRYGNFDEHAEVTQSIKAAMQSGNNWSALPDDMKEALEMTAHKMGRILNGDFNYIDSWTDICGYNRLVEKRLIAEQASAKAFMSSREETSEGPAPAAKAPDQCDCPACQFRRALAGDPRKQPSPVPPTKLDDAGISEAFKKLIDAGIIVIS